jgi:hypothetical protein
MERVRYNHNNKKLAKSESAMPVTAAFKTSKEAISYENDMQTPSISQRFCPLLRDSCDRLNSFGTKRRLDEHTGWNSELQLAAQLGKWNYGQRL